MILFHLRFGPKRTITSGICAIEDCRFANEDKWPGTKYTEVTLGNQSSRGEPERWTEKVF
jgi:hypothetical protein